MKDSFKINYRHFKKSFIDFSLQNNFIEDLIMLRKNRMKEGEDESPECTSNKS